MRASSNTRKIVYGLLIVAIFGALFPYSNWLNDEKRKKDLGEAAIGQVDTGGFMLNLMLLGGARGMAANWLWSRAEELKREQDWDQMKSTVDLITKLQPHFLSVWTFQGWNLAYNVSVEWDAPEDKYDWIKQGIVFLEEGVSKNRRSPDLLWDTAWTYYHKLGFADEAVILRRLFYDDPDEAFKTYVEPDTNNRVTSGDSFLVGYGWFTRSVALADQSGTERIAVGTEENLDYVDPVPQRKGRPGDLAFRAMPAHARTRYAAGLEKMSILDIPATFGEKAKIAWNKALAEWVKFGTFKYLSHNEIERDGKLVRDVVQIDDETNPAVYNKLNENQKYWASRWGDQMNYRYWKDRCLAEMTDDGVEARRLFYEGTIAYKTSDFGTAVAKYKQGLDLWKILLDRHKQYRDDDLNKKDTGLIVKRYLRAIRQNGQPEPADIPFRALAAAAEIDNTVDPFDAVEMGIARETSGGGSPGTAKPSARPANNPAAPRTAPGSAPAVPSVR